MLGIQERDENKEHARKANDILEALVKRIPGMEPKVPWKINCVANYYNVMKYYGQHRTHLNKVGKNNIRNCIKEKVLCKRYSK